MRLELGPTRHLLVCNRCQSLPALRSAGLALAFTAVLLASGVPLRAQSPAVLWYRQPAAKWEEALPVGNGRLGAMVFGGVTNERIQLNENSIWAGPPVPESKPGGPAVLARARQLFFAGKYVEGEQLVEKELLPPAVEPRSYQPLGDLLLSCGQTGPITGYRRELNLDTGVATTSYQLAGVTYRREVFASRPYDVLVVHLSAGAPGKLSGTVALARPDSEVAGQGTDTLVLRGQAEHGTQHKGVRFEARFRAYPRQGQVRVEDHHLVLEGCDEVTLVLAAATDYNIRTPSRPLTENLGQVCERRLKQAAISEQQLQDQSITAHQRLFRRVSLDLGAAPGLPIDERLNAIRQGSSDPALEALYFQFGRYLLIGSSRPGSLPANLQGLWNEHMQAPWNSDYHININLQMNYWPAEVCNLSDLHEPFFDYLEGLEPAGRRTARDVFGCGGFCACLNSDPWRWTVPYGSPRWGMWVTGGAWCTQDFMEHYRFTGDLEFLRRRAYPILKESSLFFLDWLVPDPKTGKLVSGPTTSPENAFIAADGQQASLSMGCSMDQEIIWDVFSNTLEAARHLGIHAEFTASVQRALQRLALPGIGSDGRLLEWSQEFKEPEPGHRHMSHLFAVHPGHQFTWESAPKMMAAARQSLEYRLAHGGGHTGWSRAWMINFWARFRDGEKAYENVVALLQRSTLLDLLDTHPPFQIDGNFGGTAGIAEMLLQSHQRAAAGQGGEGLRIVELLPALPTEWANGSVRGLRARGGFELAMKWNGGKLAEATLRSLLGRSCELRYGNKTVRVDTRRGQVVRFNGALENTVPGDTYPRDFKTCCGQRPRNVTSAKQKHSSATSWQKFSKLTL